MYTEVVENDDFKIRVWMISAKAIKPNNETMSVYSLTLYNFEKNKSFSMNNSIGWSYLVQLA